jgi:NAD(P)-dependent dehydrogenase (short-subunit alcohol dehydrogenase family)
MDNFRGKVAVITGAASGIGRALAEHAAREGMKVVLADIEEPALAETAETLKASGAAVLPVQTDVSQAEEVEALARKAWEAFGAVHLLCNNAGVAATGSVWESAREDWEWVLGVNLWGVLHGLRSFVPRMLEQDVECHVVNTASVAGLLCPPGLGAYNVSKHGVVALTETLYYELAQRQTKVKVSVLCPGFVNTRIHDAARNRPSALRVEQPWSEEQEAIQASIQARLEAGMPPAEVASHVFAAIREGKFYILTHPEFKEALRTRMGDILMDRSPTIASE